jgi:hypothetical protein
VVKAALRRLFEAWPRALSFEELWTAVQGRLGATPPEQGRRLLAAMLLECYLSNLVALHVQPPQFVLEVSARPTASPLARVQAASGPDVSNRRHRLVTLNPLDRIVVQHLDGSRDRGALLDVLMRLAEQKALTVEAAGPDEARAILDAELGDSLRRLAGSALLVAEVASSSKR